MNQLGKMSLFLIKMSFKQKFGKTNHSVHRCADLMTDDGQEIALCPVGRIGLIGFFLQPFVPLLQLFYDSMQVGFLMPRIFILRGHGHPLNSASCRAL